LANYVKFKQGLKKDFNTTNQPLANGMIYFVIDENNNGSIYYDTIVDGKKATKKGAVHRVKFSGLPIKITGSVIGTGVISQDGETIEINTSTNHSHGLAHQDFTVALSNDDTNLKWTRLGNQNGEGFWLKSVRGQTKAPAWFLPDFSAGIAFGGSDTKGIISVKYSQPGIRFAGGNGDAPVWYFTITGANNKSYDLSKIGGHSSDSAKLDHNVTFKIASTADATKGGNGTTTNLSGAAVDLYLPTKISGFDLLQATRFQGNADTSTVAAKLGKGGNTSLPMTFYWDGSKGGQPTWLWGGENGTDMYVYNPSNFRVAHSVNTAGLDHDVTFKISKVANATTGETGVVTKLTGALLELILPASISGFNLIQSTRFQGNADSATIASRANSLFLNPSNRQENIDYQINSDKYQSRVTYSLASSITKTGKPPVGDSHVLTFGWDGSGWGAQLAITADAKPHMAIRGAKAGEKGVSIWDETWSTVLDSSNYTSYINNYYWADVKVSTTANAKTNPNFFNVTSSGWFFSNAPSTGWQNSAHGGGIYMKDSSYVRIYGGKKFAVENTDSDSINTTGGVKASDGFTSDSGTIKVYVENNNEINFGGTNPSTRIYFGYRKKTSKEIPSIFIFGGETGTASIQANAGWFGQKYLSGDNWIGWYTKKGDTSSKRYGYIQTDISDNGNMRFVKEGGGYFTFNSHVNPNQTNAYDLGTQALAWRTLYVTNLNLYGQTANRLVWTNGANAIQASHHYASSTQISIGDTSPVGSYTFYVKGDSLFQGNIRVANNIYMTGARTSIYWDSDTYRQRLLTTDDSTANTPVFTFQQSEDAASSWKNLLVIRDNGVIEPLANSGGIYKNFTANNQNPVIWMNGNDTDNWLWQISSGTSTKQYYEYGLKYIGTGSGVSNVLRLYADNQGQADIIAIGINQNGQVGIGTDANGSHRLMVSGTGYFSDTLYATHIGITNTSDKTGKGISLFGGNYGGTGSLPTYGIAFSGVGTFDSHGAVCNDWATYFTMDSTSNRGWIFRAGNTNVASINNKGYAAFNATGRDNFIAFPDGGSYTTKTEVKTGYLRITLPQRRSNTMLGFKISIYNYSSDTSCEYVIKGYNYQDGVWHNCTAYSIGHNGNLSISNLPVRYGETASNNVIYIGDVATNWRYPQIQIHDVTVGFNNYEYKKWCCNWNIDFVTTLENVTGSVDKPNSSYAATKLLNTRNIWGQPFDGTADVTGQLSGATRVMNRSTQPLYLGNADNSNWVFTQDICSHSGASNWAINISGYSWFNYTNIGYQYDSRDSGYRLRVNGASYIDGNLTIPNKSCFTGILGSNSSTNSGNVGGLTWFDIEGTAGAAVDTNDTPSSAWWYVLRNRHTNTSNNYYTDIAIPFNDNSIYYKIVRNGSVAYSKWIQVLDVNNYTYTLDGRYVLKTGDTMTGNLNFTNNKGIHGSMAGGSDYWEIIGSGTEDNGRLKIKVGDNATTDWLDFEFKDWSDTPENSTVYNPMQMTGNKVIINCRLYEKEWIQFDNYTGLYSPNNDAHLFPNNVSTYGQWAINGSKGGYSGIHLGKDTNYMTIIDSGEHKGLFQQGFNWIVYFKKSSNQVGIRTSSLSGYSITCKGDVYVQDGWLRTTGSTGWYSESYGGGWYMSDSIWMRSYNDKPIYTAGGIYSPHANIFICASNEFNFIPDSYNNKLWFNYQSWSRPTPGSKNSSLISEYRFGNGQQGLVDYVYANTFVGSLSGTATNATHATNADNADTTDGVHLEWSGEQAASATDWIAGWSADGKKIKAVRRSALATKNSDVAAKLGQSGNVAIPMTFYWNGQGGQPNWIWGGNDGTNMYVYSPSNFSVSNAGYIRSMGNQKAESGRTAARGGVYTYNMNDQTANGAPTTYLSVVGFGNGTSGHIEIAGQWTGSSGLWMRGLRDCCDDWYSWNRIWCQGNSVTGAVWNDYAECRQSDCSEPGRVVFEKGDDTLTKTEKRLQHFAGVISDTWGFSQGETDKAKTNIAVAGRVLVYTYQNRNNYKPGDCVCAAPDGTIDIMTREEIIKFPDRIVGIVSCVPDYEEWGGGKNADRDPVKINGRIWIKVK
jgi:hypothetical protein